MAKLGEKGIGYRPIVSGKEVGNITNWKINQMLKNPAYMNKSTFFLNGKPVKVP